MHMVMSHQVSEMTSSSDIQTANNQISANLQSFPVWEGSLLVNRDLLCNAHMTSNRGLAVNEAFIDTSLNLENFIPMHKFNESIPPFLQSKKKKDGLYLDRQYNVFKLIPSSKHNVEKFCLFMEYLVQKRIIGVVPLRMASCLYVMAKSQLDQEEIPHHHKHGGHFLYVLVVTPKTLSSKVKERRASNLVKFPKRKDFQMPASMPAELQTKLHLMKIEPFAAVGSMQLEQLYKLTTVLLDKDQTNIDDELLPTRDKDCDGFFHTPQTRKNIARKLNSVWAYTCRARMHHHRPEELAQPLNAYGKKSILKWNSSSAAADGPANALQRVNQHYALCEGDDRNAASSFTSETAENQSTSTSNKRRFSSESGNRNEAVPIKVSRPSFIALGDALSSNNVAELTRHPDFMVSDRFKKTHKISLGNPSIRVDQLDIKRNDQVSVAFCQQVPFSTSQDCPYAYENDPLIKSTLRSQHGTWIDNSNSCQEDLQKVGWVRKILHQNLNRRQDLRFSSASGQQSTLPFSVHSSQNFLTKERLGKGASSVRPTALGLLQSSSSTNSSLGAVCRSTEPHLEQQNVYAHKNAESHGHPQDPRLTRRSRLPASCGPPLTQATLAVNLKNGVNCLAAAEQDQKTHTSLKKIVFQRDSSLSAMARQKHSANFANKLLSGKSNGASTCSATLAVSRPGSNQHCCETGNFSNFGLSRTFQKLLNGQVSSDDGLTKTVRAAVTERLQLSKERMLNTSEINRRQFISNGTLTRCCDKIDHYLGHASTLATAEELSSSSACHGSVQSSRILSSRIPIICTGKRISFNKPADRESVKAVPIQQPALDAPNQNCGNSQVIPASVSPHSLNTNIDMPVSTCNYTNSSGFSQKHHSCETLTVLPTLPHLARDQCSHEQDDSTRPPATSRSSSAAVACSLHLDDSYIQRIREKRFRVKLSKRTQHSNREDDACSFSSDLKCLHPSDSGETSTSVSKILEDQHPTRLFSAETLKSDLQVSCDDKRIAAPSEASTTVSFNLLAPRERSSEVLQSTTSVSECSNNAVNFSSDRECVGSSNQTLYSEINTLLRKAREIKQNPDSSGVLSDRLLQLALHLRKPIGKSSARPKQDVTASETGLFSSGTARSETVPIVSGVAFPITSESCRGTVSDVVSQRVGGTAVHYTLPSPILTTGSDDTARTLKDVNVQTVQPSMLKSTNSHINQPTDETECGVLPTDSPTDSTVRVDLNKNDLNSVKMSNEVPSKRLVNHDVTSTQHNAKQPNSKLESNDANFRPCKNNPGNDVSSYSRASEDQFFSVKDSSTSSVGENMKTKSPKIAHVKPQPVNKASPSFYVFNPRDHPTCDDIQSLLLISKGIRFDMKHVADVISSFQSDCGGNGHSFLQVTKNILDKILNAQTLWIVIRSADMDLLSEVPYMSVFKCAGRKVQFVQADNPEEVQSDQYTNILNGEYGILIPVSVDVLLQSNSVFLQLIKWMGRLHEKTKLLVWRIALHERIGQQLLLMSKQSDVGEIRRKRALRLVGVMEEHPAMIIRLDDKDNNKTSSQVLNSALTLQLQNLKTTRHIVILTEKGDEDSNEWDAHRRAGFAVATVHQFVRTVMEDNSETAKQEKPSPYSPLLKLYHVNK